MPFTPAVTGFETILVLSSMGTPLYSARGLHQTLTPIGSAGYLLRDINGELCNLSDINFAKYQSTVTGEDARSPAANGVMPGLLVTVDCIVELAYLTAGPGPTRAIVSGSSYTEGTFTRYRPQLIMMVTNIEIDSDEWESLTNWTLSLEEV